MKSGALFEKVVRFIVSSLISSIIVFLILKIVRPGLFSNGMSEGFILVLIAMTILCWGYSLMGLWEKVEGKNNA